MEAEAGEVREQVFADFFRAVLSLPHGGPRMTEAEAIERRDEFVHSITGK